jgi:hypothetical protein
MGGGGLTSSAYRLSPPPTRSAPWITAMGRFDHLSRGRGPAYFDPSSFNASRPGSYSTTSDRRQSTLEGGGPSKGVTLQPRPYPRRPAGIVLCH